MQTLREGHEMRTTTVAVRMCIGNYTVCELHNNSRDGFAILSSRSSRKELRPIRNLFLTSTIFCRVENKGMVHTVRTYMHVTF